MPGARLGAGVYTFTVGDALERKQITDPDELRNMVATGKLDTTLAPLDGSVKPGGLPKAMHRKYYKSMSGFCDTPKEVVEGIKRSLCEFDDVVSRCAPQTVVSFFSFGQIIDTQRQQRFRCCQVVLFFLLGYPKGVSLSRGAGATCISHSTSYFVFLSVCVLAWSFVSCCAVAHCRTRHNFIASNPNTMLNNGSRRKWKKQENFKN